MRIVHDSAFGYGVILLSLEGQVLVQFPVLGRQVVYDPEGCLLGEGELVRLSLVAEDSQAHLFAEQFEGWAEPIELHIGFRKPSRVVAMHTEYRTYTCGYAMPHRQAIGYIIRGRFFWEQLSVVTDELEDSDGKILVSSFEERRRDYEHFRVYKSDSERELVQRAGCKGKNYLCYRGLPTGKPWYVRSGASPHF